MARFTDIADVSFLGDITLAGLKKDIVKYYNEEIYNITGVHAKASDENKATLYAAAQIFYQMASVIDIKARQNLLKYATGEYLDNLGLSRGLTRKKAEYAVVTLRFTASANDKDVAIGMGTRVTDSKSEALFATTETVQINKGEGYVDVLARAVEPGAAANRYEIDDLCILVDPIAYVASVTNTDVPAGGADTESDDEFAERIYLSRNVFSTAGSESSYIYYTKSYSSYIDDVVVTNPQDADIDIYILTENRNDTAETAPALLKDLKEYLDNKDIRPMTDNITVKYAEKVNYDVNVKYYVLKDDASKITDIQKAVKNAAEQYTTWQDGKIGRDIDPQRLLWYLLQAGVVRVEITNPTYKQINLTQAALFSGTIDLEYGGLVAE